ncbi:MAG TPA: preprotein translocase subunit SecY, partial [Planctomycetota bacterium]|nr:preprotein translocase subunit SecY [Planctomycetota bacterium]
MRILAAFRKLLGIAEVRRRILWTFGLLGLFRLGSHLPLPGLHPAAIEAFRQSASRSMGALWNVLELFSGGALGKLAVGCLGIAPYITASILVQMMTRASARLEALSKEGLQGQRFLQRLTRWVTLPIAIGQAAFAAGHLREASLQARLHGSLGLLTSEGVGGWVVLAAGLVAGSFFTLWLSEQITERGLGNGQSLIILAGIVARWPALAVETLRKGGAGNLLLLAGLSVVAILGTVVVARAE